MKKCWVCCSVLVTLALLLTGCGNSSNEKALDSEVVESSQSQISSSEDDRITDLDVDETISESDFENSSATDSDIVSEIENTPLPTETEAEPENEVEKFIASGKMTLMLFLQNASDNGYSIENPQRGDIFITATAQSADSSYKIRYMVENQHVYAVEIFADSIDDISSVGYLDCVYAMARAINPDIDYDSLAEAVEKAISTPDEAIVNSETQFLYSIDDLKIAVSY